MITICCIVYGNITINIDLHYHDLVTIITISYYYY